MLNRALLNKSRRTFIQASSALVASQALRPLRAFAATPFTLPKLPYDFLALEPYIDTETMKIHHGKHHQTYIDKLNEQISKNPSLASLSLEEINSTASKQIDAVRNNAGGHFNHSLFWEIMAPAGKGAEPSSSLKNKIDQDFGGLDAMKEAINNMAISRFGSGWAWLVFTKEKKLVASQTPYQDNPSMDVADIKGIPLLGIDVWEHAYYLKYQNKRADYLKNWWSVVNWNEVNKRFSAANTKI
jgi:superoxide dismutase, Fe-Mn family